jgi:dTDP-4-amino-4,6-dideoxygalactose transaminase
VGSFAEGAIVASQKDPVPRPETPRAPIPVLKPLLPPARALLPYLERIDASRTYSNWGPLLKELSERLTHKLGAPDGSLVCANSGMSALVGAILAAAGRASGEKPLAIIPDYTFTATALAAQMCGYQPVLASCANGSWSFGPEDLQSQREILKRTALVVPVAPYGRLVAQEPWQQFQAQTGIPVVIDGAACFDLLVDRPTAALGPIPLVLSFHATKSFATGEGGCVVTTDAAMAERVLRCLNFGFLESRNTAMAATNGKMPEYGAAVGLAELDAWDEKRAAAVRTFRTYQRGFAAAGLSGRLWGPPDISCAYTLLECSSGEEADAVIAALARDQVDTRRWYGDGLQSHDAFSGWKLLRLHGEAELDPRRLVGLPCAVDLSNRDILRICYGIGVGQRSMARSDAAAS